MPGSRPGRLGRFDVPVAANAPARGTPVSIAVRPEKIHLHWTAPDAGANALAGRLNAKAYFGDRSHYFVEVAGMDKLIAVARQNADREVRRSRRHRHGGLDDLEARGGVAADGMSVEQRGARRSRFCTISSSPAEGGRGSVRGQHRRSRPLALDSRFREE